MTCCCSLHLLYKVHTIKLDLQLQLHRSIFSLLVDWTIKGTIISRQNTAASVSRSSIFSRSTKHFTRNVFWEPGDDHNEPSSSSRSRRLFVSNHLFLIFSIHFIALSIILRSLLLRIFMKISWSTINFKTKNGSRLVTEYYAFTIIRVDQVNFLREKFGVSAYSRISTVSYFPFVLNAESMNTYLLVWNPSVN